MTNEKLTPAEEIAEFATFTDTQLRAYSRILQMSAKMLCDDREGNERHAKMVADERRKRGIIE